MSERDTIFEALEALPLPSPDTTLSARVKLAAHSALIAPSDERLPVWPRWLERLALSTSYGLAAAHAAWAIRFVGSLYH
ncbi:MAG TPA: hypothetical protein VHM70_06840 [Polyangiaceae bacterium]|jgi:hypothetical protein|nr:hypothetical protein [Polyangiaceae bacterium]